MKIAWLQDLDPFTHYGGAQQTDKEHIIAGFKLGHEIEIVLPGGAIPPSDLTIISNAQGFPIELLSKIPTKYIFFLHDYWGLCKWRLHYPMLEKCKNCYLKPRFLPLLQKSLLNIFLSPLHRESWLFTYPELESHNFALIPSPINVSEFCDLHQERAGMLAIHAGLKFKGYDRFKEFAEERHPLPIDLIGDIEGPLPPNVKSIEGVPYYEMNALYNKYETFVHLPTTPQPFERTVAEAYLSGCKVITNGNVGALSWEFFNKGRNEVARALSSSSKKFWTEIELAVGGR